MKIKTLYKCCILAPFETAEKVQNKDAKVCILMLFTTNFCNCIEKLESTNAKWCILTLVKRMNTRIPKDTLHAMEWTNRQ